MLRVVLFIIVLLILMTVLLSRQTSQKGGIWKAILSILQIASLSANNRPNQR